MLSGFGTDSELDLYRTAFAAIPVPALLLDADLVITDATSSYLQTVDRALDDLVGRFLFDAFPDPSGHGEEGPLGRSLRTALESGRPDRLPVLNYAVRTAPEADEFQERWWSVVNIPLLDRDGRATALVNAVEDVTPVVREQRRSELAQAAADDLRRQTQALTEDLQARALDLTRVREAEARNSRRLAALAEVALELATAETVGQLTDIVVGRGVAALGADGGAVAVLDPSGTTLRLDITASLGSAARRDYTDLPLSSSLPACVAARTGRTVLLGDRAAGLAFSAEMAGVYETIGREAWASFPLRVGDAVLGSITFSWKSPQDFDAGDVGLLHAFAAQCSQALDRLLRRRAERAAATASRRMSEALQRSLLSTPVQPGDLEITARYLPAARGVQVGGDWYDAFRAADGSTQLVVGDASGHDRDAAAVMAQVRNVLRGIAHRMVEPPAAVLSALDHAMADLGVASLVTAVLAKVEPDPDGTPGSRVLRWSNAGHPPPLLIHRDGRAELLTRPVDLLLGMAPGRPRHDHEQAMEPDSTVLFYTDGFLERRGASLDDGFEWLRATAEKLTADDVDLEQLCDALLGELQGDFEDDVALLAVRASST